MKNSYWYCLFAPLLLVLFFASPLQAQQTNTDQQPANAITDSTASTNDDDTTIYTTTDVAATVDKNKWRQHLQSRLGEPTMNAMKNGIQPGKYTVAVQFVVEKDGHISEVKALNDPGYDLAKSAIKIVKAGPKWTAAEQKGKKVRSYHTQPLSFVIGPTKTIQL